MKVNFAPPEVESVLKPSSPFSQYDSFHDMRQLGVLPPRWDANSLLSPPPPNISSSFHDNFLVPIYNPRQLFKGPIALTQG